MEHRLEGEVKWFSNERGYGFVNPIMDDGTIDEVTEYFVHFTSIKMEGFKTLQANQRVFFELKETPKGVQAVEITPLN
jgi:CspA family cold shock protein